MIEPDISTAEALALLQQAEHDPHVLDRRRFLQLVGMGAGAGLLAGPGSSLLEHALGGHDPSAWAVGPLGSTDGVLVVVGLFGGNDGLNTVVPIDDDRYYEQHGALAIDAGDTLRLDASHGLNPRLTELKSFWDRGELAIVDGVGYPNQDLSHFSSMANWMSGTPHQVPTSGWVGRWADGYLSGTKDLYAVAEIGHSVPLHLIGQQQRGTAVPTSKPSFGAGVEPRDLDRYAAIRAMQSTASGPWFSAVGEAFADQLDLAATLSPHIPTDDDLPENEVAARLEVAARMINANLGFRVLTVGFGDFDSHAGQPSQHDDRMTEFNAGVKRFFDVLSPAWDTRVTVMTFSEFGRTSWSNDGAGTDHGSSAPHLVIGRNVRGGIYGQQPSLAGLRRWERMEHHVDFRSYYASILDGWMGGGSSDVLNGSFEDLKLFRRGPGRESDGTITPPPAVVGVKSGFHAVSPVRVADTRDGSGVAKGAVGPKGLLKVKVAGVGGIPSSGATAVVANVTAVDATSPMYLTVFPGATARPGTSNINGGPGRPVPNLVVIGIGDDGCIDVFNSHGQTHCLVDVFGYFAPDAAERFSAVTPARLFDTRTGDGVRAGKLQHLEPIEVKVAGRAGVPASGATAVVLNLTVTEAESPGYLRVTPAGESRAKTSNVNFGAGDTVPNLVICKLGAGGKILVDGAGQGMHALGDVFGYFGSSGAMLRPSPPERVLDTRIGEGAPKRPIGPSHTVDLTITGRGGVPEGATAVVLNVAAVSATTGSFVTVWPRGHGRPGTSNLNIAPNQTIANLVICQLGEGGGLMIGNKIAECDVLADVLGYFVP